MTAISASVMAYLRTRSKCNKEKSEALQKTLKTLEERIDTIGKRLFRVQKALILKAQLTDEQIKHDHPGVFADYEKIIKEMLEDDKHNL